MNSLSFIPNSATLRVQFIMARARLMIGCASATLSDDRLICVTEQMNKIADALHEITIPTKIPGACGAIADASALISRTDAAVLADLAQRRHTINAAS
jgi:hypothetical protein